MKTHFGILILIVTTSANNTLNNKNNNNNNNKSYTEYGIKRVLNRIYEQCDTDRDFLRCLKIQGIKLFNRALNIPKLKIYDGILMVKNDNINENRSYLNNDINNHFDNISSINLDNNLYQKFLNILETRQLNINIPKLLANYNEGRGKKKKNNFLGPFLILAFIKAGILKIAYHSIAIIAAKALIISKIALIISAIIGLKKLLTNGGNEKTTYEIIKHPHIQQSHTYSTSNHAEYDGQNDGGGYHRSIGENELLMQDKAYRAHIIPRTR